MTYQRSPVSHEAESEVAASTEAEPDGLGHTPVTAGVASASTKDESVPPTSVAAQPPPPREDAPEVALSPVEAAMRDAGDLIARGQPAGARMILQIAARSRPVSPALCVSLARVNETLGNWKEAADWYATADQQGILDDGQQTARLWDRQRARCLYRADECAAACSLWEATLSPGDRTVGLGELVEYADACLRIDDRQTAQKLLDQASMRTSGRVRELELLRATCALRRGDTAEAHAVATAALEEWPDEERFVRLVDLVTPEDETDEEGDAPESAAATREEAAEPESMPALETGDDVPTPPDNRR